MIYEAAADCSIRQKMFEALIVVSKLRLQRNWTKLQQP